MDIKQRATRGADISAWDMVYKNRLSQKNIPQSMNSSVILEWLLTKGHLPFVTGHNLTGSGSPFMELEAKDDGLDISVSLRLRKGCNIKDAFAFLGERLADYAQMPKANPAELDRALCAARCESHAIARDPNAKPTPNISRAVGLYLWDAGEDLNSAIESLMFFLNKFQCPEADKLRNMEQESLRRLRNKTGQWITNGEAGKLS